MVQDLTLIADEDGGVPDAADAGMRALVEADMGEDAVLSARLLDRADFLAVDEEAFLG